MPHSFNIPRKGFTTRKVEAADEKAFRMLLPDFSGDADRLVAVDGEHGLVIGAAAATRVPRRTPAIGPGVAIHVIPPCRRCGVGGALLEQLEQLSQQRGAQALYAAQRVELAGPEMTAWQWLEFSVCETVEEHELPLAQFEGRLAPLVERLQSRGHIPKTARIIPLYAANADAVVQLHQENMGGDPDALLQRIRGQVPGSFQPRYSRVLLLDDRVAGCILGHRLSREVMRVDANILAPEVRGGWANVWLKLEATRGALSLGIERFRFSTFDHYTDTRSFTEKLGGVTTRSTALMYHLIS